MLGALHRNVSGDIDAVHEHHKGMAHAIAVKAVPGSTGWSLPLVGHLDGIRDGYLSKGKEVVGSHSYIIPKEKLSSAMKKKVPHDMLAHCTSVKEKHSKNVKYMWHSFHVTGGMPVTELGGKVGSVLCYRTTMDLQALTKHAYSTGSSDISLRTVDPTAQSLLSFQSGAIDGDREVEVDKAKKDAMGLGNPLQIIGQGVDIASKLVPLLA